LTRRIKEETGGATTLGSVGFGLLFALGLTLVCSLVYALVVAAFPLSEKSVPIIARAVAMAAAFLGGMAAGRRSDRIGWLHGALVGLVYMALTLFVGRAITPDAAPLAITVQRFVVTVVVSTIGGIAGVNL
jgi:putative membrane protein (TIGR04086 family)